MRPIIFPFPILLVLLFPGCSTVQKSVPRRVSRTVSRIESQDFGLLKVRKHVGYWEDGKINNIGYLSKDETGEYTVREGLWLETWREGPAFLIASFKHGIREGGYREWWWDGSERAVGTYLDGESVGRTRFYWQGKEVDRGQSDGPWVRPANRWNRWMSEMKDDPVVD